MDEELILLDESLENPEGPTWRGCPISWPMVNRYLEGIALLDPGYEAHVQRASQVMPGIPATRDAQREFIQALGRSLYGLLPGSVREGLLEKGPRRRLVVVEKDDAGLPWEYLWVPGDDIPLCLRGDIDIVRVTGTEESRPGDPVPLRVLPVAVQPEVTPDQGFQAVDIERDLRPVLQSLPPAMRLQHQVRPRAELDDCFELEQFEALLEGAAPSLLHLAAHGAGPRVLLCDAMGKARPVTGARLGGALREKGLRCVVLCACGAAGAFEHRGAAAKLAADLCEAAGVPWLLASRVSLSSRIVRAFFGPFYRVLASKGDMEEATRAGRAALFQSGIACFGGLVLYGASPGVPGHVFSTDAPLDGAVPTSGLGASTRRIAGRVPMGAWVALLGLLGVGVAAGAYSHVHREHTIAHQADRLEAMGPELDAWVAEGRTGEARALLDEFEATVPAGKGGGNLAAQAWAYHHDRCASAGEHDEALQALVRAYQVAAGPVEPARMLSRLGLALAHRWEWTVAENVLDTLDERHPRQLDLPEALELRAWHAGFTWDMAAAAEVFDELERRDIDSPFLAWRGIMERFSVGTRLGLADHHHVEVMDLDGDGGDELVFFSDERITVVDPSSLETATLPGLGAATRKYSAIDMQGSGPDLLAVTAGPPYASVTRLLELVDGELREASVPIDAFSAVDGVAVDLDMDGRLELYVIEAPMGRRFLRLDRAEDGLWRVTAEQVVPSRNVSVSDINGMVMADLDRDGRLELALAVSSWYGHELRVVGHNPADGLLRTRWRKKLGNLRHIGVLAGEPPIVAVSSERLLPSVMSLGEDNPWGSAVGIHLFRRGVSSYDLLGFLDPPYPTGETEYLTLALPAVADLDGSGGEILASTPGLFDSKRRATWFARPGLEGQPGGGHGGAAAGLLTGAFDVVWAAGAGDQGGARLLVYEEATGEHWLLGHGEEPFPPLELPSLAATWSRGRAGRAHGWSAAESLATVGMFEAAAGAFKRLALRSTDTRDRLAARVHSAELLALAGDWDAAASGWRSALKDRGFNDLVGERPEVVDAAIEAFLKVGAYGDAWQVRQRGEGSRFPGDDIERLATAMQTHRVSFVDGLPSSWRVLDPLALAQRAEGLEVRTAGTDGMDGVWHPIYWGGGALRVRLDLALEQLEWISGFGIELAPAGMADEPLAKLGLTTAGGGGLTRTGLGCKPRQQEKPAPWSRPGEGAHSLVAEVEMAVLPELGITQCTYRAADGALLSREESPLPADHAVGRYELHLKASPRNNYPGFMSRTLLRELVVEGPDLALLDEPVTIPTDLAARWMYEGQPEVALEQLEEAARGREELFRSVALYESGRQAAAVAAMRRLMGPDVMALPASSWDTGGEMTTEMQWLADLVRVDGHRFNGLVRDTIGTAAWLWTLHRDAAIHGHPNQGAYEMCRRVADDALAVLDLSGQVAPGRGRDALVVGLRHLRGQALFRLDRLSAARDDLLEVGRLAARHGAGSAPALDPNLLVPGDGAWFLEQAIQAEALLARIEARLGRKPAALRHARTALHLGQHQDFAVDALLIEPRIRQWAEDRTDWAELVGDVEWVDG